MGDHNSKTVVIVGAGASYEFNLPVGNKLMELISEDLFVFGEIENQQLRDTWLNGHFKKVQETTALTYQQLFDASSKISSGLQYAQSIDNFLHSNMVNPAIVVAGKLAIANIIVKEELNSTLYRGTLKKPPQKLQTGVKEGDSWLHRFFKIMTSNKSFDEFIVSLSNVTFVSFNYDRCIQQFFWIAVHALFTTTKNARERAQEALNIEYVYGNVGEFEYDLERTNFGNIDDLASFQNILDAIRTFTEGESEGIRERIRDKIDNANNLLILGFGFIPINTDLIFQGKQFGHKIVLSTAFGLSEPDRLALKKRMLSTYFWSQSHSSEPFHNPINDYVRIKELTASGLFHEYSQFLKSLDKKNAGTLLRK